MTPNAELIEDLRRFLGLVVQVWDEGVFGVDIGHILVAMAIFVGFLLIRRLFTKFVLGTLRVWATRTKATFDDQVLDALDGPVRMVPIVLGVFFTLDYLRLPAALEVFADHLVRSLIAFDLFWAFHAVVDPLSFLIRRLERVVTAEMVAWLVKAIKLGVLLVGGATILEIWGIEVAPVLAGLGLFGVAVALGAQDLFKNLIAGLLIIAEKRFRMGDWILVEGVVEGTVETIGFRSTMIRRFDKAPVHVPNSRLADNAVTNFSAMTARRIYWQIGVEYRTTVDQLRRIRDDIEAYIVADDAFEKPPRVPTFVHIDRFSPSSIDIMLYCFTRTTNWGEWLKIKESLAYKVKEVVEDAGASFAFPSQSVYVEALPSDQPEPFVPPGSGKASRSFPSP